MKIINSRDKLPTVLVAIFFSAVGQAEETAIIPQEVIQTMVQDCETCHGLSGQGNRGSPPIPRLAGQQIFYIENQLKAFSERRRDHKDMNGVSHVLGPEMWSAVAKQFSNLNPKPLGGAPKELVIAGKELYEQEVPGTRIVPCALCHGAKAQGDGAIPRLAGQINEYIVDKLNNWSHERGLKPAERDASSIMRPIVQRLTKPQIEALAAYLNYLE
jgi:cytochrome c553